MRDKASVLYSLLITNPYLIIRLLTYRSIHPQNGDNTGILDDQAFISLRILQQGSNRFEAEVI